MSDVFSALIPGSALVAPPPAIRQDRIHDQQRIPVRACGALAIELLRSVLNLNLVDAEAWGQLFLNQVTLHQKYQENHPYNNLAKPQ